MSPEPPASKECRLHPAGAILWWIDELRRLWGVFLILLVSLFRDDGAVSGVVMFVILFLAIGVMAVIRHLRFRYVLVPDGIVLRGGVIHHFERVIPRPRVQSVDVVEKLRHRLFGVVEVRVEAIGGGSTEGQIRAVSRAESERIREHVLPTTAAEAVREARPLVRLRARHVFLAGVTGGRVAVIGLLLGVTQDLVPEDFFQTLADRVPSAAALVLIVVGVLAISVVVSLVMTVLVYWDFSVRREDDRLIVSRGLLDRRRAVVPLHRVQLFRIEQNIVRRMFGLAAVRVVVAGYAGEREEVERANLLLPIGSLRRAQDLVSGLLPMPIAVADVALEPAPARALRRRIVRGAVAGLALGAIPSAAWWPAGAWGFLAVPAAIALAFPAWRALGHAITDDYLVTSKGLAVRRLTVVPLPSIQRLHLRATPFQRRARLASLQVHVPKSHDAALDLDRARAGDRFATVTGSIVPAGAP